MVLSRKSIVAGTYPLNPDGELCPLLNDGDLLLSFYDGAGARPDIKKFIKRNRWPGKPPLSYSVGTETMKKMLLSLHNSREGRDRLAAASQRDDDSPVLHQVIWMWLGAQDPTLIQAVDKHGHSKGDRLFMSPDDMETLVDERLKEEMCDENGRIHLVYLALAFAMLQPEDGSTFMEIVSDRMPEFRSGISGV